MSLGANEKVTVIAANIIHKIIIIIIHRKYIRTNTQSPPNDISRIIGSYMESMRWHFVIYIHIWLDRVVPVSVCGWNDTLFISEAGHKFRWQQNYVKNSVFSLKFT